jgi:hypothetical protein
MLLAPIDPLPKSASYRFKAQSDTTDSEGQSKKMYG